MQEYKGDIQRRDFGGITLLGCRCSVHTLTAGRKFTFDLIITFKDNNRANNTYYVMGMFYHTFTHIIILYIHAYEMIDTVE